MQTVLGSGGAKSAGPAKHATLQVPEIGLVSNGNEKNNEAPNTSRVKTREGRPGLLCFSDDEENGFIRIAVSGRRLRITLLNKETIRDFR